MSTLAFFGLGYAELAIILILALIIFGSRLPGVARSLGRSLTEFKRGINDVKDELDRDAEVDKPTRIAGESEQQESDRDEAAASVSDEHDKS